MPPDKVDTVPMIDNDFKCARTEGKKQKKILEDYVFYI